MGGRNVGNAESSGGEGWGEEALLTCSDIHLRRTGILALQALIVFPLPPGNALMKLLLDDLPAPGKAFAHVPVFESRIIRVRHRFADNFTKLRNQPRLSRIRGTLGLNDENQQDNRAAR